MMGHDVVRASLSLSSRQCIMVMCVQPQYVAFIILIRRALCLGKYFSLFLLFECLSLPSLAVTCQWRVPGPRLWYSEVASLVRTLFNRFHS